MLDEINRQRYIAGLAAHTLDSLERCQELDTIADYYIKRISNISERSSPGFAGQAI